MEKLKQNAIQNLEDIKRIFDNLNISFWLDGGALLGAYRDKDFPAGDEDDIDLGCLYYAVHDKLDLIISEAEGLGFSLYLSFFWGKPIVGLFRRGRDRGYSL